MAEPFTIPIAGSQGSRFDQRADDKQRQDVAVQSGQAVIFQNDQFASNVASGGGVSTYTIKAAAGKVWEVHSLHFYAPGITGASGDHQFEVEHEVDNEKLGRVLNDGTDRVGVEYSEPVGRTGSPEGYDFVRAIRGTQIDENDGLVFRYTNDSDTEQTGARVYTVSFREVAIA